MEHTDSIFPNYPEGYFSAFTILLLGMASFSLMQGLLTHYLMDSVGFSQHKSYALYTIFSSLIFGLPLITNTIAQRCLGYSLTIILTLIIGTIGLYILCFNSTLHLYFGLTLFLIGNSGSVAALYVLLGRFFCPEDYRRNAGFTFSYTGINLGGLLALALSSLLVKHWNFQSAFIVSAMCMVCSLLIYLLNHRCFYNVECKQGPITYSNKNRFFGLACFVILIPIVQICLNVTSTTPWLWGIFSLLAIYWIYDILKNIDQSQRKKMIAFFVLIIFAIFFWSLYALEPAVLDHFAEININHHIGRDLIPDIGFYTLNPLFIVIISAILAITWLKRDKQNRSPSLAYKFSIGLALMGIAFLILAASTFFADTQGMIGLMWILACYLLLSTAEVFISPIGLASVGRVTPRPYEGTMIGVWLFSIGIGVECSSYLRHDMLNHLTKYNELINNKVYATHFCEFGLIALGLGLVLALMGQYLTRLIKN